MKPLRRKLDFLLSCDVTLNGDTLAINAVKHFCRMSRGCFHLCLWMKIGENERGGNYPIAKTITTVTNSFGCKVFYILS